MSRIPTLFITGIDTDAGKTYATAWLARRLASQGLSVVTQKCIQTGNRGHSEDIDAHRRLAGTGPLPEDAQGLTAPIILSYPASAQLAARMDGITALDLGLLDSARRELERRYDAVLVEGAGGMMVPITDDLMAIDYALSRGLEVALVTNARLGSINHTLLSLEALRSRGARLRYVLYNQFHDADDPVITADTRAFIGRHVSRHWPGTEVLDVPVME